jgi:hypothetical protein
MRQFCEVPMSDKGVGLIHQKTEFDGILRFYFSGHRLFSAFTRFYIHVFLISTETKCDSVANCRNEGVVFVLQYTMLMANCISAFPSIV